jgi:hypothetical protein
MTITKSRIRYMVFAANMFVASPILAQSNPIILNCSKAPDFGFCQANLENLTRQIPLLRNNNYQAMRNVAFCQWGSCEGSVVVNRQSSCEWRRKIMRVHYKKGGEADRSDESNLSTCSRNGF